MPLDKIIHGKVQPSQVQEENTIVQHKEEYKRLFKEELMH